MNIEVSIELEGDGEYRRAITCCQNCSFALNSGDFGIYFFISSNKVAYKNIITCLFCATEQERVTLFKDEILANLIAHSIREQLMAV